MPHVDDGTLHALLDGALRAEEPDRADRVEAHLDACADCRARLERAAALKDQASSLLDAMDATGAGTAAQAETGAAPDAMPDFAEVLDRARAHDSATASARPGPSEDRRAAIARQYRWTRGLAWAATIVVALGTGYLVRGLVGPEGAPRANPVVEGLRQSPGPLGRPTTALDTGARGGAGEEAGAAELVAPGQAAPETRLPSLSRTEPAEAMPPGAGTEPDRAAAKPESAPTTQRPLAEDRDRAAAKAVPAEQDLAEPTGAQPTALSAAGLAAAGAVDSATWRPIDLDEAEARVGPILVLPRARLAGAEAAPGDSVIRTLQLLPGDVEAWVIQRVEAAEAEALATADAQAAPAPEAAPAPTVAARERPVLARGPGELRAQASTLIQGDDPVLIGVRMDSVAATVAEPQTVTVLRDGVSLTVTARLTPDLLQALAAAATPRAP